MYTPNSYKIGASKKKSTDIRQTWPNLKKKLE
jgi:hypothetical protein